MNELTSGSGRRLRRILFNSSVGITFLATGLYVIWCVRPLILPVALGILLAYLFRPLKQAFKYSWLPNGLRVALLLTFLTCALLFGIRFVKDNLPNDKEKLEILVRLKYQLNEKFDKLMAIDPTTGKGNTLYNLIAQDVNPIRKSLNDYLELTPEQSLQFESFHRGVEGFERVPEKYYSYYLANLKSTTKKTALELEKKEPIKVLAPGEENQSFLKTVISILSIWFLLPIVFLFFLIDDGDMGQFFVAIIPNRYFELALTVFEEVDGAIGKYLRGISMQCGLVGLSMAVGLHVVGVPFQIALIIGVLAGVATAIPLLGPIVGLSFGLSYSVIAESITPILPLITQENFPLAVVVVNILVFLLDNFVFQPFVLGGTVDLHPLVVVLGLTCASLIFGVPGVLLAIPAIVVAKVIIQHTFRGLKDYRII